MPALKAGVSRSGQEVHATRTKTRAAWKAALRKRQRQLPRSRRSLGMTILVGSSLRLRLRDRHAGRSLGLFGFGFFGVASADHDLNGVVIALAAGVLPQRPLHSAQGNDGGPGFRPRIGIVHGEFVLDGFGVD